MVPSADHKIEAVIFRGVGRMPHVPLAKKSGRVARVLECFTQRKILKGQIIDGAGPGGALIGRPL